MKISFYYWRTQCPIIHETLNLLKNYERDVTIDYYDVSNRIDIAKKQQMFFPFLTVFDDCKRWFGPLNNQTILQYMRGELLDEKPHVITQSNSIFKGDLVELNADTIHLVSSLCTLEGCLTSCQKKHQFLSNIGESFYGYLNMNENKVVGGVEFVPSLHVPYPIPKNEKTAFLTCSYPSSEKYDYKTFPFQALEKRLSKEYNQILAISDEVGTFPNGDLKWFIKNGFKDLGLIQIEENYCRLHLVIKNLKANNTPY